MGEYAHRISDGAKIKIGTCESMYYLRYEDKNKVKPDGGSEFGHYWRLPFPDEDRVLPGEYDPYERAVPLHGFEDKTTVENPGILQMRNDYGLLINVPCYHGEQLPEEGPIKAFWNGKCCHYQLAYIRSDNGQLFPIVRCAACGHMWRYTWDDVIPHILDYKSRDLKNRLIELYAPHFKPKEEQREEPKEETPPPAKKKETLSNAKMYAEYSPKDKEVFIRDLTDRYNEPASYNRTKRSLKKAWAVLKKVFCEDMTMYAASSILSENGVRMHSYCMVD